ncbi:MAG: hypothetical protein V1763_01795 [Parcubacteria group bacterium]
MVEKMPGYEAPIPMSNKESDELSRKREEELSVGTYLMPEDLEEGMQVRIPGQETIFVIDHVGDISEKEGSYYLRGLDGKQQGPVRMLDKHPLIKVE